MYTVPNCLVHDGSLLNGTCHVHTSTYDVFLSSIKKALIQYMLYVLITYGPRYGQLHPTEVYQPWISVPCALTKPNPRYGQSHPAEVYQPWISVPCALTKPNPRYGQSHPTEIHQPINLLVIWPSVSGLLMGAIDHILG
jgi:hypothetical protein